MSVASYNLFALISDKIFRISLTYHNLSRGSRLFNFILDWLLIFMSFSTHLKICLLNSPELRNQTVHRVVRSVDVLMIYLKSVLFNLHIKEWMLTKVN